MPERPPPSYPPRDAPRYRSAELFLSHPRPDFGAAKCCRESVLNARHSASDPKQAGRNAACSGRFRPATPPGRVDWRFWPCGRRDALSTRLASLQVAKDLRERECRRGAGTPWVFRRNDSDRLGENSSHPALNADQESGRHAPAGSQTPIDQACVMVGCAHHRASRRAGKGADHASERAVHRDRCGQGRLGCRLRPAFEHAGQRAGEY